VLGAVPRRRVNRRRTAGPGKVRHSPARTMTGGFQAAGQLTWFIFRCYGFIIARMHARTAAFSCWGAGSSASLDIWQRVSAVGNP
jgi:hypothetical protein